MKINEVKEFADKDLREKLENAEAALHQMKSTIVLLLLKIHHRLRLHVVISHA